MAAGSKKKTVNRLEDLEVHEVSGVDRPANKRPFLVVKNDDGTEVTTDADGNLVVEPQSAPPAPAAPAAPAGEVASMAALLKAFGEQLEKLDAADPIAKRLAVSDEARGMAFKAAREAMRRIDVAMATMSMAEIDDNGSPEFMALIASELADVSKLLSTTSRAFKPATTKADTSLEEVEKAISAATTDIREEVEKAGAKMASQRLTAFRTALKTLTSLLSELDPTEKTKTEKAFSEAVELNKALDESLGETKRLAEIVKKQSAELIKLRSSRTSSNAVPVEEVSKGARDDGDDEWPLDMNHENRGTVDKSVSFG